MNTRPSQHAARPMGRAWLANHRRAFVASLLRCVRRPWATLLTVLVMGIALLLPMGLSILMDNVRHLAGTVETSRTIDLFLHPDFTEAQARDLSVTLHKRDDVADIDLRTPDQGLQELREKAGMGAAIDALEDNPLPSLLVITPTDTADVPALVQALDALPQTDLVQHDAAWRQRLEAWLQLGERLSGLLSLVLGLGAMLVVGNTVRLELQDRAEEVRVLQLLGADEAFIRRPFLYLGGWYGLGAGAVALAVWGACVAAFRPAVHAVADSYGSTFVFKTLDVLHSLMVLLGAGLLGLLGAALVAGYALRRHRVAED